MGPTRADWYADFFGGLAVEFWLRIVPPEATRQEADFLERALALAPGARVLDVPCGGGRHAVALAQRGYRLTGIDRSTDFLAAARRAGAGVEPAITWRQGDMRELPAGGEFDAVYCFGNSFGYLEPGETERFCVAVGGALRAGGRFAIDYGAVAESALSTLKPSFRIEAGDIVMEIENHYRVRESCLDTQYTFSRGEQRETCGSLQRVFTVAQVGRMLSDAGMELEHLFAGPDGQEYRLGSQRGFFVARKL